jgi:hypothetical protein
VTNEMSDRTQHPGRVKIGIWLTLLSLVGAGALLASGTIPSRINTEPEVTLADIPREPTVPPADVPADLELCNGLLRGEDVRDFFTGSGPWESKVETKVSSFRGFPDCIISQGQREKLPEGNPSISFFWEKSGTQDLLIGDPFAPPVALGEFKREDGNISFGEFITPQSYLDSGKGFYLRVKFCAVRGTGYYEE